MPNYGTARLTVAVKEKRSVVIEQFGQAPLQLHRPLYLDANSFPTVFLRTPSYGLLDGDIHELFVQVEEGAQLELRTQGATLVYPGASEQKINIRIGSGGRVRFLPHPLILAAQASLKQRITIELADESELVFKESWVCGRIAMGERWQFNGFDNLVEILRQGQSIFRESFVIQPQRDNLTHPAICGAYTGFETKFDLGVNALDLAENATDDLLWHWRRQNDLVSRRLFMA
jgi:urease accessory protein